MMGRDYSRERELRNKRVKRFVVEMEIEKAANFQKILKNQNLTFSGWAKKQMEMEMGKNEKF
jgi:hypothetical protein